MGDQILTAAQQLTRGAGSFRVLLDGTWYGLRLCFNTRMRSWTLDVAAADGTPLVLGLRVVVGVSLLAPIGVQGLPRGQLFAVDALGEGRDPGRDDLRERVELVYRPAADVAALAGTSSEVL